jgi:hypothetical protein
VGHFDGTKSLYCFLWLDRHPVALLFSVAIYFAPEEDKGPDGLSTSLNQVPFLSRNMFYYRACTSPTRNQKPKINNCPFSKFKVGPSDVSGNILVEELKTSLNPIPFISMYYLRSTFATVISIPQSLLK